MAHKTKQGGVKRACGKSGDRTMARIGSVCLGLSLDEHQHIPNRFRPQQK
jgi:hypothetical protein